MHELVKGLVFGGVIAKPTSINLVWFTLHCEKKRKSALEDLKKNILVHILLTPLYASDWPSHSVLKKKLIALKSVL